MASTLVKWKTGYKSQAPGKVGAQETLAIFIIGYSDITSFSLES